MGIKIVRVIFVIVCIIMGVIWASHIVDSLNEAAAADAQREALPWQVLAGLAGAGVGVAVLFGLSLVSQDLFQRLSPALVAIVIAMLIGWAVANYIFMWWTPQDPTLQLLITTTFVLLFGFAGIFLGLTRASHWESLVKAVHRRQYAHTSPKVVDTSVIIDGRISDICESGFVDGVLLIPRFVLRELQNIADSPDSLRRARGRRGLDILRQIQEDNSKVQVEVIDDDPPGVDEVDSKLVYVAKDYNAKIITNDYNLNKVAQIEKVQVLNINDLANALKPAVLPDEQLQVKIIKEGKEAYQGVGYLDDGTMVVVDGGRDHLGREAAVMVTSVLQTAAGRMIFGKMLNVVS